MNIPEAIKINAKLRREYLYTFNQDPIDALGLGIEALQLILQLRAGPFGYIILPLPSETPEQTVGV